MAATCVRVLIRSRRPEVGRRLLVCERSGRRFWWFLSVCVLRLCGGSCTCAKLLTYDSGMPSPKSTTTSLETVEPIGSRVLIRKDEDKKQTKSGIHLPDKIEIPTITGRIVTVSREVELDENYPIRQYDRVLFNPKHAIPVDFEGDNRLFVVPVEDVVAVFRKEK